MSKKPIDVLATRWTSEAVACATAFIEGRNASGPFGLLPDGRVDLRCLPLTGFYRPVGVRIAGVDFTGLKTDGRVIFAESRLHECAFDRARMDWGDFHSEFEKLSFVQASLRGADFGSRYVDCDFTAADMRGSTWIGPVFDACRFEQTRLDKSVLSEFACRRCVFAGTYRGVLFGTRGPAVMEECDLTRASFPDCSFKHAKFDGCRLSDRALLFTDWPAALDRFEERTKRAEPEQFRVACQRWAAVSRQLELYMPQNLVDLDDLVFQHGADHGTGMFGLFSELRT
jgi:uncharacterized protein YjbI with pentapeptide repeats